VRSVLEHKVFLASFLTAACALPAFAAGGAEKTQPASLTSFGVVVEVNVVNVEVYATDRDGKRVTDLKREDFAVSEDGKPVEVTNFAAVSPGRGLAAPVPAGSAGTTPSAAPGAPRSDPESALSLVVFLDGLHLRPEDRTKAVEQIRAFLAKSVRPGDRVMVATHGLGLQMLQPFTEDRAAIDAALKQAETLGVQGQLGDEARRSAFRAMNAMQSANPCGLESVRPIDDYAAETRDEALRTVGALTVIINSLAGVPGHRALLLVSDGISITPGEELFAVLSELCGGAMEPSERSTGNVEITPHALGVGDELAGTKYDPQQAAIDVQKYSVAKRFEDLAAHASANRVTLYTLQASGLQGFAAAGVDLDPSERRLLSRAVQLVQTSNLKGSLTALAADTGGRAMLDANDLGPELARMQEDFESFYSLGYTPAHQGDGRQHKVEVKVKRPGLRVRYRPSYRDKPALEKAVDRTLTALLHGIEDNPLEVAVELGAQTLDNATGTWAVPVRLKIPLYKLAIIHPEEGGSFRGRLRLLVATRDGKGGTSPVRQVEVPVDISRKEVLNALGQHYLYTLTLKLPAGEQRVAVAVRDELGSATSYLSRAVSVGAVQAAVNP
jgi:VWFA-related protein